MFDPRPPRTQRGGIRNLEIGPDYAGSTVGDTLTFWFQPRPVREALRVAYGDSAVLGMSHVYRTYEYTSNATFAFEVYVNRIMLLADEEVLAALPDRTWAGIAAYIEAGRRFLEALYYPPARPGNLPGIGNAPPACLLSLPGIATLRCRVVDLAIEFRDVDAAGIKELAAQLTVEEAPLSRITMQDVLDRGMFRDWAGR